MKSGFYAEEIKIKRTKKMMSKNKMGVVKSWGGNKKDHIYQHTSE